MKAGKEDITSRVNRFYNNMPFNFSQSASYFAEIIAQNNSIQQHYPNLHKCIENVDNKTAIDIGCGTGWFTNSIAYYYNLKVTGVDLCQTALDRAIEISKILGIENNVKFKNENIFNLKYWSDNKFYLINTIGVLHHTYNCHEALSDISFLVEDHGCLHIGLYHKYGREPFLDIFKHYREKIEEGDEISKEEEQEAFNIFKNLNSNIKDDTLLRSWFRDQVMHPHETQHTFREVYDWLKDLNFEPVSTSVNDFQPIGNIKDLFEEEKKYYEISKEKNIKQRNYYPGFFTVLARKGA